LDELTFEFSILKENLLFVKDFENFEKKNENSTE
jgi:hypothetical protein